MNGGDQDQAPQVPESWHDLVMVPGESEGHHGPAVTDRRSGEDLCQAVHMGGFPPQLHKSEIAFGRRVGLWHYRGGAAIVNSRLAPESTA